jgi:hypothetical protein
MVDERGCIKSFGSWSLSTYPFVAGYEGKRSATLGGAVDSQNVTSLAHSDILCSFIRCWVDITKNNV